MPGRTTSGTTSGSRSRSPSPSARATKQRRTSHPLAPPAHHPTHTALPPLKRNSACKQCRKRRIRCDAGKPHCAACARSFEYLRKTHPDDECVRKGVQCYYDDDLEPGGAVQEEQGQGQRQGQGQGQGRPERRASMNGGESTTSAVGKQKEKEKELSSKRSSEDRFTGIDHQRTIRGLQKKIAELHHTLKHQPHPNTSIPSPSTATTTNTNPNPRTITPLNPGFTLFNLPPETDPTIWPAPPPHSGLIQNLLGGEGGVSGWLGAVGGAGMGGVGGAEVESLWGVGGFGAMGGMGGLGGMDGMPGTVDFSSLDSAYIFDGIPSNPSTLLTPNTLQQQPQAPRPQPGQRDQPINDPITSWADPRGCPSLYKPPVAAGWVDASAGGPVERVGSEASAGGSAGANESASAEAEASEPKGWESGWEGAGGREESEVGVVGWPAVLPTPEQTHQLIEIFFTRIPSITRLIHRPTLLSRLARGPSHPDFPHRALLHAICAIAAYYCEPVCADCATGRETGGSGGKPGKAGVSGSEEREGSKQEQEGQRKKNRRLSETQAMHAMRGWDYNLSDGKGLFDRLQAMVILSHWFQSESRWTDCWITIGCATRLSICLGLVHHNTYTSVIHCSARSAILAPPVTDVEREERRATMYYVLCLEVMASASPGWAETLPGDEMTTRLPASRIDFERGGEIAENPQDRHSPDIYYNHPVPDSFVMVIKGQLLLSRANKFARRCRAMDSEERAGVKETVAFRRLEGDIATFVLSFPPELREPVQPSKGCGQGLDTDLFSAHLLPQIANIFLHEPLADLSDPTCPSALRIISAAKLCSSVVTQVVDSWWCQVGATEGGWGLSGCVGPLTCFCLITAARTLILFYKRALEVGDMEQAGVLSSEIEMYRKIFKARGKHSATGNRYLLVVDLMIRAINAGVSTPSPSNCPNSTTPLPHHPYPRGSTSAQGTTSARRPAPQPLADPPSFFPPTSRPYSPYHTCAYGSGPEGEAQAQVEAGSPSSGSGVRSTDVSTPGTTGYTHSHTTAATAPILTPTAGTDLPELRDTHPDSIELNELRKALIAGDKGAGVKIQDLMDRKRGFVRARREGAVGAVGAGVGGVNGGEGKGRGEGSAFDATGQILGAEKSAEEGTQWYAMGGISAEMDLSIVGGGFGLFGGAEGDGTGDGGGRPRGVIYDEPTPLSWLDWPEDR